MTDWSNEFIAVDWGTTNRRAYLIGPGGAVHAEIADDLGVATMERGAFPAAVGAIAAQLGRERPMLLAGMVGSNRGWHETAYVPCPAALPDVARALHWVEPGRTAIVPGLCASNPGSADVMRGEEVQVFGLGALDPATRDGAICHPGTHTKWIAIRQGAVTTFRTVMTGEMFALLRAHSILAPMLQGPVAPGPAFLSGVDAAHEGGVLTAQLFSVRGRVLLGRMNEQDAASYTSGLLIGWDIRAGADLAGDQPVTVLGQPALTCLYAAALVHLGVVAQEFDGAQAFTAGMHAIREMIR